MPVFYVQGLHVKTGSSGSEHGKAANWSVWTYWRSLISIVDLKESLQKWKTHSRHTRTTYFAPVLIGYRKAVIQDEACSNRFIEGKLEEIAAHTSNVI